MCLLLAKTQGPKKGFIGQAIIQAARPRVLICPLQLGLAVQLRNQFQSRFIIEELSAAGFCSGYTLVTKYQKSAVVCRGTDITITSETDTSLQYEADNVDRNVYTLDGYNTLHAMGQMCIITPAIRTVTEVLKVDIKTEDIFKVGCINIPEFILQDSYTSPIKFSKLTMSSTVTDSISDIDLLWKISLT